MTENELLTTTEAGCRLGVSLRVLQLLIKRGDLPATKRGRDWFVAPADLDALSPRAPGRPRLPDDVVQPASLKRRAGRRLAPPTTT